MSLYTWEATQKVVILYFGSLTVKEGGLTIAV